MTSQIFNFISRLEKDDVLLAVHTFLSKYQLAASSPSTLGLHIAKLPFNKMRGLCYTIKLIIKHLGRLVDDVIPYLGGIVLQILKLSLAYYAKDKSNFFRKIAHTIYVESIKRLKDFYTQYNETEFLAPITEEFVALFKDKITNMHAELSQGKSNLLGIFMVWSSNPLRLQENFVKFPFVFDAVFQLLTAPKLTGEVAGCVLQMLANLLGSEPRPCASLFQTRIVSVVDCIYTYISRLDEEQKGLSQNSAVFASLSELAGYLSESQEDSITKLISLLTPHMFKAARAKIDRFHQFALLGMLASGWPPCWAPADWNRPRSTPPCWRWWPFRCWCGRRWCGQGRAIPVDTRTLNILTAGYIVFFPLDFLWISQELGPPTVHLVCFVAIIKLLTARTPRDYFFLKLIAFLELLAASILSTNLTFFIALVCFLGFTSATLASAEIVAASRLRQVVSRGCGPLGRRLIWLTSLTALGVLVLTGTLFFALPRTAKALLDRLLPGSGHVAGFSNEVTLGLVGDIRRQATTVMHIRFGEGMRPPDLKWRGSALAEFNGWKWYNSARPGRPLRVSEGLVKLADDDELRHPERRFTYEVVSTAAPLTGCLSGAAPSTCAWLRAWWWRRPPAATGCRWPSPTASAMSSTPRCPTQRVAA